MFAGGIKICVHFRPPYKSVWLKMIFFLFLNPAYVVGTQKSRLNEHPKQMFQQMNKKIIKILCYIFLLENQDLCPFLTLKAPISTAADDKFLDIYPKFSKKIMYDISWESSASRPFSWNIMPNLLFLKKRQNFKLSSAANYRWRFKG